MLSIAFGQSKYYVDNLRKHVWYSPEIAKWNLPAWAPLGYVNDKRLYRCGQRKAKYIKWAFEMYATGEYPRSNPKDYQFLGLVGKKAKCFPSQIISICSKIRFTAE